MGNPVAVERILTTSSDVKLYRAVYVWCPGCNKAHSFTVELFPDCPPRNDGTKEPVWDWDGNLERPTFSPSMLAYFTIHLCPPDYVHHYICDTPELCGESGHLVLSDEPRVLGHNLPHKVDPAWGNCHSFLRQGEWEFLSDSAHALAGQKMGMIPLPDFLI